MPAGFPNTELIHPSSGTALFYPQSTWPGCVPSALAAPFSWMGARRGDHWESSHTAYWGCCCCCCALHIMSSAFRAWINKGWHLFVVPVYLIQREQCICISLCLAFRFGHTVGISSASRVCQVRLQQCFILRFGVRPILTTTYAQVSVKKIPDYDL